MAFVVGMNLVTSADSASPSGTSIPVTKGGTGATDKTNALKNLLPDLAGNDGKVLGLTSGEPSWVERTDAKSSNDIGKVKIDSTDKTMTTNGDIGVNGTSKVSINRPDLWTVGVEYDFGNNLYGIRSTGTISIAANTRSSIDVGARNATTVVSGGGYMEVESLYRIMIPYSDYDGDNVIGQAVINISNTTKYISLLTLSRYVRNNAPYDIWVTYKK